MEYLKVKWHGEFNRKYTPPSKSSHMFETFADGMDTVVVNILFPTNYIQKSEIHRNILYGYTATYCNTLSSVCQS